MQGSTQHDHARLSLRANFSWTFVGNVVYAACQWGMLVVIARLGSPEMVGRFALGLAVTAPIFMLTNLQLRSIQATDAKQTYAFSDYLTLRLLATVLGLLVIGGVVLASGYDQATAGVVVAVGLAKAFEAISDVFFGLFQQTEQMDKIAKSMIWKGLLSLLILGAVVASSGSMVLGALGLALAWAMLLGGYDVPNGARSLRQAAAERLRLRWHTPSLRSLTIVALPLGLVMMLISLNTNIPRYFIEQYSGARELGVYAALSYLIVAGGVVVAALGQSATPRLAQHYAQGQEQAFRALLCKLVLIGAGCGGALVLIALLAGRELLTLLYGAEYARPVLFVWLSIAAALTYVASFLGYGITAAHYFRIQLPLFAGVSALNAALCAWLVPTIGLLGAAYALIGSTMLQIIASLWVVVVALRALHPSVEH